MSNLKESFLQRHLVWQFIFFGLGLLMFIKCGKEFWFMDFNEDNTLFLIAMVSGVALGGALMASPYFIRNWARKKLNK